MNSEQSTVALSDRYLALIDEIVESTLKGKISSVEMVYQMLQKNLLCGTGEVFELVLSNRLGSIQSQVDHETDELKKSKANRQLRAIKTIQSQWLRYSQQNKATETIASAVKEITTASPDERLSIFLRVIDPNQKQTLNIPQLQQLAKALQQFSQVDADLQQISQGITRGLASWQGLQDHLVSWMYEKNQQLGFGGVSGERGPWATWAKQVKSDIPQRLFRTLAMEQSAIEFAQKQSSLSLSDWVELAMILQYLQRGLVNWFDQQAYNIQAGSKLSISTFLTFAVIWSQLAKGFHPRAVYTNGCSQIMLQILRNFSQRSYFPLYGGIFASFAGNSLRDALDYLDEPLRRVEGTQEKARILTILGYSQRALGQYQRSIEFHQQALDIARNAGDCPCEIANLNHLSRTYVQEKNYTEAINYSQRALMLSRQSGERIAEANALVNLGYSEVMQAQKLEQLETELYETAINYLEQGLKLSEQLGDIQSQALCLSSLGVAYLVIGESQAAIPYLENGFKTAQVAGDLYLQGRNLAYLSAAYYNLQNSDKAIYTGSLGMYLLEQISSNEWRQPAGLLTILQGQIGAEAFQTLLNQHRHKIMAIIGVDGYDYIPQLLAKYQEDM
ncbi:tetratricopeptide repeat protein [Umezakia ovalisporum]|uniref:Tetratricopeptide repeat protein n=1 Tax=Umezakia ovalisporum FSS-43 TaxID=2740520 RepID=A0ABT6K1M0_9CYAN|nr:tetratricopeptide repeat protein [Umezakia ovalisporum]MDH6056169.1 tetratricopeptide repeat protein [Umezakia ovalisporum FSS-43]MDH6065836.1 tetratricopeptide repeat protein [Umezakia ovalisporum APH033B]MDH6072138.1 tetratricopeptide repeat protein [Umezakia ovalisporum CobakiLakeA]MDH6074031.1 tetratricopeptide repeat protein [Umezakia ovalisporum CS-1034]MDH6083108.1 tetratricopeptide repeat protein [Umezakia ovalisporum FSS-44]